MMVLSLSGVRTHLFTVHWVGIMRSSSSESPRRVRKAPGRASLCAGPGGAVAFILEVGGREGPELESRGPMAHTQWWSGPCVAVLGVGWWDACAGGLGARLCTSCPQGVTS